MWPFSRKKKGEKISHKTEAAIAAAEDAVQKATKVNHLEASMNALAKQKRQLLETEQDILMHQTSLVLAKADLIGIEAEMEKLESRGKEMGRALFAGRAGELMKSAKKIKGDIDAAQAALKKFEDESIRLEHIHEQEAQISHMEGKILKKISKLTRAISIDMTGKMRKILDDLGKSF